MIVPPCATGLGDAAFVTERSGCAPPTTIATVAVLLLALGSAIAELTLAASVMTVPFAVPVLTLTTTAKLETAAAARSEVEQVNVPVFPVILQFHPAGGVTETSVVLAGTASTKLTLVASLGPLLVTTCV